MLAHVGRRRRRTPQSAVQRNVFIAVAAVALCLIAAPATASAAWGLDAGFGSAGVASLDFGLGDTGAGEVVVRPDGKILMAARGATGQLILARYDANGALDPTFSGDGYVTSSFGAPFDAGGLALAPDGRIVVAGHAGYDEGGSLVVARYTANGALDASFSEDGWLKTVLGSTRSAYGNDIAVQTDGKIVVAGRTVSSAYDQGFVVARFSNGGALDTTFDGDGIRTVDFGGGGGGEAEDVVVQTDGKIVVAGDADGAWAVARLTGDGNLDPAFDADGRLTTGGGEVRAVALQPDGRIVAGGDQAGTPALTRYNPDGTLDNGFSGDGKMTTNLLAAVSDIAVRPDGTVVGVGSAATAQDFGVVRVTAGGEIDTTFSGDGVQSTDFAGSSDRAYGVALQTDGKPVVAGSAYRPSVRSDTAALVRYATDGALDVTFSGDGKETTPFPGGYDAISAMAVRSDGSVVAAGSAAGVGAIARLTPAGAWDQAFGQGGTLTLGGESYGILAVALQPDGKTVASVGGLGLIRLEEDGTVDTTFNGDEGMRTTAMLVQPDGKIVASDVVPVPGSDTTQVEVTRYNADGSPDTSFAGDGTQTIASLGSSDSVAAVTGQPDGKIVVVGETRPGEDALNWTIIRLTGSGALDTTFSGDGKLVSSIEGVTESVAVQADGKIVVGGGQGPTQTMAVARFTADGSLDSTWSGDGVAAPDTGLYPSLGGLVLQPDGKVIAAGSVYFGNDQRRTSLVRFATDGTLDPSFSADGRLNGDAVDGAKALVLAADGDILVGGSRDGDFAVARFDPSGVPSDDVMPPNTTIDSGPTGSTSSTSATFTFSSDDPDAVFECRIDTEAFGVCSTASYHYVYGLDSGSHTFEVRARDTAGNVDPSPATRSFTVTGPVIPNTTIQSGPSGTVASRSATLTFSSDVGGATFECSLDGGSYASCSSPKLYENLDNGQHTVSVRAVAGGQTDGSPATRTWNVFADTTGPDIFDTTGPEIVVTAPTVAQHFRQGASAASAFSCSDTSDVALCSGPATIDTSSAGEKTFTVTAEDTLGNTSQRQVLYVVDPPPAAVDPGPTPPPAPQPDGGVQQALRSLLSRPTPSIQSLLSAGKTKVIFGAPSAGTVSIEWTSAGATASVVRKIVIARGTRTLAAPGAAKVTVRLTVAGRKLIKRAGKRLKIVAKAGFRPAGGAWVRRSSTLVLKRRP